MPKHSLVTQYIYETRWRPTREEDAVKIIEEEVGDADPKGTWTYVQGEIEKGKTVMVGECRFKMQE